MSREDASLFPTELKDPQVETSKLPPLNPSAKKVADENNENIENSNNCQNNEPATNEDGEQPINIEDNTNQLIDQITGQARSNHTSNNNSQKSSNINSPIHSNASSKRPSAQQSNIQSQENSNKNTSENSPINSPLHSHSNSPSDSHSNSHSNSPLNSPSASQNHSGANSSPSTPLSNRSSKTASLSSNRSNSRSCNASPSLSYSYNSSVRIPKTSLSHQRRVNGRLPPKKLTYNQEMNKIPTDILYNPYVTKRLNIFPLRNTKPPRAAMSHVNYRNRSVPPMDDLTNTLLNDEKPENEPTIEELKNSANILRQMEKDLIEKSQYPEAKKVANAYERVSMDIKMKSNFYETKSGLEELIAKRNELLALADSIKSDWNEKITEQQNNTIKHVNEMKAQHQEQIKQFDSEIPEELTPLFKRNSVTYLNLRSKEKYLAFNRHFDEAEGIKVQADKIEEMEREANFEKMFDYYRNKKEKLIQLQQLTISNYLNYSDSRKAEMETYRDKSIQGALNRAANIDKQIKRICEKKGIKQKSLNLDIVDEERIKLIKEKEQDDPIPRRRVNTSIAQDRQTNSDNNISSSTPLLNTPNVESENENADDQNNSHSNNENENEENIGKEENKLNEEGVEKSDKDISNSLSSKSSSSDENQNLT
ncbi:hypothetical protein TRFO_39215 [Tritrichomonas foetus]|uniref:Uncharacterized protein n=1 Tax=Tritrichomonas foetus TaxID=1144522 RepID=A0A1J4JAX3_9EUKA|nr:hypothetical protein TRFO_39215 [Tritrichomonas foetus]|eukprot:OHS94581.1 hypothetical protein TRFO_39215 [Tritrichomonas foetus]